MDPVLVKISPVVDQQLDRLRLPAPLDDETVHDFRVLCKQLRALLQLYRSERSAKQIQLLDKQLKVIARSFSGARDSVVIADAMLALGEDSQENLQQIVPVVAALQRHKDQVKPDQVEVAAQLDSLMQQWWASLACDKASFAETGMVACYKKARALANKVLSRGDDEVFHQWRKWAKYWLYQLQFLEVCRGASGEDYLKKLDKLGNRLGRFHDDCILESTLHEHSGKFTKRCEKALLRKIHERKKKLKRQCRADAELLFGRSLKQLKAQGIIVSGSEN